MANTTQEQNYKRQLDAAKGEKKKSLFQKMGTGRVGRYAKVGMLTAGMLHPSGPSGGAAFQEESARDAMNMGNQGTYQQMRQEQSAEEAFFGKGAQVSMDNSPKDFTPSSDGGAGQQERAAYPSGGGVFDQQHQSSQKKKDEEQQTGAQNEQQEQAEQKHIDPQKTMETASKVGKGVGTVGQVGSKTVETAAKGGELAAKGGEVLSRAAKKGGQQMVKSGAQVSKVGYGAGALVGVPMMAAGGLMTAGGTVGEGASKVAQQGARATQKGARAGYRASSQLKRGSNELGKMGKQMGNLGGGGIGGMQNFAKGKAGKEPGLPSNVSRILSMRKRAAGQGVKGMVEGAVNQGASMATSQALAWSWRVLIPTFGLTILYINFHFVARYIAHSNKFCDFGEEWAQTTGGSATKVPGVSVASGALEYVEILAMIFLDFILAMLLVLVFIMGYAIINPDEIINIVV